MAQIKKQYTNPVPILYLYRNYPEISLVSKDINSATDITLNQQINEVTTLSFKMPYTKDRKISPNDCEKLVKFEGEYYIIKEIKLDDDNTRTLSATCYHESVELKGVYCSYLDLIGVSPEEMFNAIMKATKTPNTMGYKWAGTDVPSNKLRHLQTDNEESVYANLIAMAEVFEGWLEFYTDETGQKWVYLRTKAIKKNKFIKKGIDMKSMGITYDSSEIFTQLEVFGSRDSVTGEELNIMGVNPTGKSYLEDYSYYLAKGIPKSVIDREPKYQQLKVLRDDTYTDANELMRYGKEELKKCSVPQLEATISLSDLSIYVDNPTIPPMVGYELICIDSDIEFNIDCMITGVNRNYTNPADTQVTISNVVRYNTLLQDITHTVGSMNNVLDGDSNGIFIPDCVVKDNNGISITVKLGDIQSNVELKYNEIKLRVDDFEKDVYAEIKLTTDSITQTVADNKKELQTSITQTASAIRSEAADNKKELQSSISQTAKEINSTVADNKRELQTQITQNAENITSVVTRIGDAESRITQTATDIRKEVTNTKEELQTSISQTARDINATITDTKNNLQSNINATASAVSSKVSSTDFNSFVQQTDRNFTKAVKYQDGGSYITQNAHSIVATIKGETSNQVIFNRQGLTVHGGGFLFENKSGEQIFKCNTNGAVTIGSPTWSKNTAKNYIILGGYALSQYLISSSLNVTDDIDMKGGDPYGYDINFSKCYKTRGVTFASGKLRGLYNRYGIGCTTSFYVDSYLYCDRDLEVSGRKNCIQETKNYGNRKINAYETCEYYFGDIYEGIINDDGECIVMIDDIFAECINLSLNYHVFTQAYNGNITKIERLSDRFIVYGEAGTEFSAEIKGKRIGCENDRLELANMNILDGDYEQKPTFDSEYINIADDIDEIGSALNIEENEELENILLGGRI